MMLGDFWQRLRGGDDATLRALMRPELGRAPKALRRVLEPVVAVAAALALMFLISTGAVATAVLFLAAGLAYLLLTYVFGLRLELSPQ